MMNHRSSADLSWGKETSNRNQLNLNLHLDLPALFEASNFAAAFSEQQDTIKQAIHDLVTQLIAPKLLLSVDHPLASSAEAMDAFATIENQSEDAHQMAADVYHFRSSMQIALKIDSAHDLHPLDAFYSVRHALATNIAEHVSCAINANLEQQTAAY